MPFYNRSHLTRYDLELYSLEPLDFCTLDTLNYSELLVSPPEYAIMEAANLLTPFSRADQWEVFFR